MSHVSKSEVRLDSKDGIREACCLIDWATFLDVKEFSYFGGAKHKCDFAVRIKGVRDGYNEVGFEVQPDGTLMPLVDWWNNQALADAVGGREFTKLRAAANMGKAVHEINRLGKYDAHTAALPDGTYKILVTKKKNKSLWQWGRTVKEKMKGLQLLGQKG